MYLILLRVARQKTTCCSFDVCCWLTVSFKFSEAFKYLIPFFPQLSLRFLKCISLKTEKAHASWLSVHWQICVTYLRYKTMTFSESGGTLMVQPLFTCENVPLCFWHSFYCVVFTNNCPALIKYFSSYISDWFVKCNIYVHNFNRQHLSPT